MSKISYRTCQVGDIIDVDGPCVIEVVKKSGRSPRIKITSNHDSNINFTTVERAHTCCDTKTTLNKGE